MAQILIATEDSTIAGILLGEVESEGYTAHWCVSGQEAYECVLHEGALMVFLDSAMAVFDAFATCEMLRADPEIPETLSIILVTGVDPDHRRVQSVGFTDVLPHVHTRQDLRELLSVHLAGAAGAG